MAAIISAEDLMFLEDLEDRLDLLDALKAMEEAEATGEKPIPWEDIKRELKV